jgi:hypothetical protein
VPWAEHVAVDCIMVRVTALDVVMARCRRTNVEDDLSWGFDHFVNMELGVTDVSLQARRRFSGVRYILRVW